MDTHGGLGLANGLVRLVEPDEQWTALFAEEAWSLGSALRPFDAAIDHCGSTSIPGMPAKPIIDVLVGIPEPLDVAAIGAALAPLGYAHVPTAGVPGHEVFGRGDPRTHLLHAVPKDGPAWDRMVRFRQALCEDERLAAEYSALKRELAARYASNRPAYTAAKASFIVGVIGEGSR